VSTQEYLAYCYSLIDNCARHDFTWRCVFSGQAQRGLIAFNRSCWFNGKPYEPSIYLIHDSADQPIYVGKSRRIIGRLKDHVGFGDFCHEHDCITPVGHYIRASSPRSHDWRISVLDLPHHLEEPAIWRHNPHFNDEYKPVEPSLTPIPAPITPF
jgi:hypothetical protein